MPFGRLERTPSVAPMSDINMTPLIDVMLVLLVIFIITAPLLVNAVKVDLPKTEATKSANGPQFLSVILDKAGVVFVNDQALDASALADAFSAAALANPDTELQLRADTAVLYGRVVEVMGAAQKAGLNRIGFVANPPTP